MSSRFTETEKWLDSWFNELSNNAKLLFYFLLENCDVAGFYEISYHTLSAFLRVSEEEINARLIELGKSVIRKDKTIWIKNFIKYQKNLPLNEKIGCHRSIIRKLIYRGKDFESYYKEHIGYDIGLLKGMGNPTLRVSQPLANPIGIGIGIGIGTDVDVKSLDVLKEKTLKSPPLLKPSLKDEYIQLAIMLKDRVVQNLPNAKVPDDFYKWGNEFRLLVESKDNKRSLELITKILEFSQQHTFWKMQIRSPSNFRKHIDRLEMQMNTEQQKQKDNIIHIC